MFKFPKEEYRGNGGGDTQSLDYSSCYDYNVAILLVYCYKYDISIPAFYIVGVGLGFTCCSSGSRCPPHDNHVC